MSPRLIIICLLLAAQALSAGELRIAVAANFKDALKDIAVLYEAQSADHVSISAASSGKLISLIANGAPFDVFFSADSQRPQLLQDKGLVEHGSRHIYAYGQLVLWCPHCEKTPGPAYLMSQQYNRLALANPKSAPYGRAAYQVLEHYGLASVLRPKLVRGQSIGNTYRFIESGSVDAGFVAYSQLIKQSSIDANAHYWLVDEALYAPVVQEAVIIKGKQVALAQKFINFTHTKAAQNIIRGYGYRLPIPK